MSTNQQVYICCRFELKKRTYDIVDACIFRLAFLSFYSCRVMSPTIWIFVFKYLDLSMNMPACG